MTLPQICISARSTGHTHHNCCKTRVMLLGAASLSDGSTADKASENS